MEWKKFEEAVIELPENTLNEIIKGFSTATNELAELVVSSSSDIDSVINRMRTRFNFKVYLRSNRLPDFAMKIFEFGYDVSLYPVKMKIDNSIWKEIESKAIMFGDMNSLNYILTVKNEVNFRQMVQLIFDTEKFNQTVSGIMKIARQNDDMF